MMPAANGSKDTGDNNHIVPLKEWKSHWLKTNIIGLAASITVCLIVAIIALCRVSDEKNGIRSVVDNSEKVLSFEVGIGLLWTFLPVLIFQAYALGIAAIVTAAAARQPYIELHAKTDDDEVGAAAEKSILLDYQSYLPPVAFYKAIEYNHYMLSFSFAMMLLLNFALTPLAAHLFVAKTVQLSSDVNLEQAHAFNEDGLTDNRTSMTPIMGVVSSALIYGGNPIPWTTFTQAFVPFTVPEGASGNVQSYNLTGPTLAYSVEVDCKVLGPTEFELRKAQNGYWLYDIEDRGCSIDNKPLTPPLGPYYTDFVHFDYADCPYDAHYSRIYVVAASKADGNVSELVNKTAVSCIPSYYNKTGSLSISIGTGTFGAPTINTFVPNHRQKLEKYYPSTGVDFGFELAQPFGFDSTAKLLSNDFGTLIFDYAKKLSSDYYAGETLLNATATMFTAAYAVLANIYLIQPSTSHTIRGVLSVEETRLVVVQVIPYVMIGILVAVLAMLLWIYLYTKGHTSILYEEPKAILGKVRVLLDSELMKMVKDIIESPPFNVEANKSFGKKKLWSGGWLLQESNGLQKPSGPSLQLTTEVKDFGFFKFSKKREQTP